MISRSFLRTALLVFVSVSLAYAVSNQDKQLDSPAQANLTVAAAPEVTAPAPHAKDPGESALSRKVIAYYFHGDARCVSCKTIEAYTKEVIENSFRTELDSGRLEFHSINLDEGDNARFVDEFQLTTRSVVLSELDSGRQVSWKNLDKVWQLVRDKPGFLSYISEEISKSLGQQK